jgi:HD-GYP domain-containing protein (c-di-GMP phosphodiesterase class II)
MSLRLKFILTMTPLVSLFVALLFFWIYQQSRQAILKQVDVQAISLLQQIIITRTWVADHGGVFVKEQPGVVANPFLPKRAIEDNQGKSYFFRNPAMITREISHYAEEKGLYKFRLTSLNLKNPANEPSPFEKQAMMLFQEQGFVKSHKGLAALGDEDGEPIYQRIVPLAVKLPCLECHVDQGYQVGEVRGALNMIIPMGETLKSLQRSKIQLVCIAVTIVSVVIFLLHFLVNRLVLSPIGHLHLVAEHFTAHEYSDRATLTSGDELQDLGTALNKMTERLQRGYKGGLRSLIAAVDARDSYTKGHTERVSFYSVAIGRELGFAGKTLDDIEMAAILHDVGKIGVADEVLKKTGRLTPSERQAMDAHVEMGAEIIREADFLKSALPGVLYHHERFDGRGYPNGLQGEEVPLVARILAIADTFDAMTTDRPYRRGLAHKEAMEEIIRNKGSQFDPLIVEAFQRAWQKDFADQDPPFAST